MSSLPDEPFFQMDDESPRKGITKPKKEGPFIIGVCGASASGKTSVCQKILDEFQYTQNVTIISLDSFYRELSPAELKIVHQGEYDFDSPDAFDWDLLAQTIKDLRSVPPKQVEIPTYDFRTHRRQGQTSTVYAVDIVLLEGILTFFDEKIRNLYDMKIFVETASDICLSRRIIRDIQQRGRDLEGILVQYEKFVKPGFDNHIAPQKQHADVIIPRGAENLVAIALLVNTLKLKLQQSHYPQGKLRKTGNAKRIGSSCSSFLEL